MNGLMVGFPPRAICTSMLSSRRLIVAQTPITGPASRSSGTSSAIDRTLFPAKSSCPVHWNPCSAPSTSAKNGSLRTPANSRIPPGLDGLRGRVEAGQDGRGEHLTGRPGLAGLGTGGSIGGPGLRAALELGEGERERHVGLRVAV